MKFCLLDAHNEKYDHLHKMSRPNWTEYCARHGYGLESYTFGDLPDRQANWGRVHGIIEVLPRYDWVFYLDTDIIISDMDFPATKYIDEAYNLVAGPLPHEGHIMTSGMLIKNCEWSFRFLRELYQQTRFIEEPYFSPPDSPRKATGVPCVGGLFFEQSAFHYLYDTRDEYARYIKLVARRCFNSETFSYTPGDFLIHFPGRYDKELLMRGFLDGRYEEAVQAAKKRDKKICEPVESPPIKPARLLGGLIRRRPKTDPGVEPG